MNFESYLRENLEKGITDFQIRAHVESEGVITFYIHPDGRAGETGDFEVKKRFEVTPNPRVRKGV